MTHIKELIIIISVSMSAQFIEDGPKIGTQKKSTQQEQKT